MSLLLLVGAGLFVRTLRNLQQVELGFRQENRLLFALQPRSNGYENERLVQLYRENYFATMEIALLRGRSFDRQDDGRAPKVAILSETLLLIALLACWVPARRATKVSPMIALRNE